MRIESREYKVMLDPLRFADQKTAVGAFCKDVRREARQLKATRRHEISFNGKVKSAEHRTIQFLDTPDETFRTNDFLLRRRDELDGERSSTFTLKCRTRDRYIAAGRSLQATRKLTEPAKFEEDISAPFVSQFSHSATVSANDAPSPSTLGEAAALFPILGELIVDGLPGQAATPVNVVNSFKARELVLKLPSLHLPGNRKATTVLILWLDRWKGRVLSAEFSFRYRDKDEKYPLQTAEAARDFYAAVQTLDWCLPEGATKTQFAYGG